MQQHRAEKKPTAADDQVHRLVALLGAGPPRLCPV
jgi:hypothetical protein